MIVQVITVRLVKTQKSGALSCLLMHSYSAMDRHNATLGVPYYRVSRIFHPCNMVPHFHVPQVHVSHFQRPRILYARIYIPYMRTILYHYIQTGRRPVPISSELKLKTNSSLAQYLSKYRHKQHLLTSIHTGEYVHRCHLVQINSQKIVCTGWAKNGATDS